MLFPQRRSAPAVTLLYAVKDPQVNHAIVLKSWLERQVGDAESCD